MLFLINECNLCSITRGYIFRPLRGLIQDMAIHGYLLPPRNPLTYYEIHLYIAETNGCQETPHRLHCPHRPQIQRYLTLNKQQE